MQGFRLPLENERLVKIFPLGNLRISLLLSASFCLLPPKVAEAQRHLCEAWWLVTETFGTYGKI